MLESGTSDLIQRVVDGGYCVGCGACAAASKSLTMGFDARGQLRPFEQQGVVVEPEASVVCPFSGTGPNEDEIARDMYGDHAVFHAAIGYHYRTLAGHVAEGYFREIGSSGGMGSWVLAELMRKELVDAAIHVKATADGDTNTLFAYAVSSRSDQLGEGAKSKYYPIEMSQVIEHIRRTPGRYAIVGLPCFIKAVRLLSRHDSVIRERVRYCIGLVCGHLKSKHFADLFGWQCGIPPGKLEQIDFRHKLPDQQANAYGVRVSGCVDGRPVEAVRQNKSFFGYLWGHGFFKYSACEFCDDVFAETADVTIGDAWLPGYVEDSMGSNIVVVRRLDIAQLIESAMREGRLNLTPISPDEAAESQAAGLRHRRGGLQYRLWKKVEQGEWYPPKRVEPSRRHLTRRYQRIFDIRSAMSAQSHIAFQHAMDKGDFSVFRKAMEPLLRAYDVNYSVSLPLRAARKIIRVAQLAFRFAGRLFRRDARSA